MVLCSHTPKRRGVPASFFLPERYAREMATNMPCDGQLSVFYGIPYSFFGNDSRRRGPNLFTSVSDDPIRFWIHIGLLILCFLLAIINFIVQFRKPVPYGKYDVGAGTCRVNQRLAYGISDTIPGIILFTLTYFLAGIHFSGTPNIVMYCLFTALYINRAIISPLTNRYARSKIAIWIPIANTLTTSLYHFVNADFIGSADFCNGYVFDPRFILGIIILVIGFVINRAADTQLICLRKNNKDDSYSIPKGPLFYFISQPNYLGEMIEWLGWTILTWSLAGLVWLFFVSSTQIPRARSNHQWYKREFDNYPKRRKALIPFIY